MSSVTTELSRRGYHVIHRNPEVALLARSDVTDTRNLRAGDIEPVGVSAPAGWAHSLIEWTQAYKAAAGEPLTFIHFDVQWRGPWQAQLLKLQARLRADGMRVGVIYNGFGADKTDEEWVQHAEEHALIPVCKSEAVRSPQTASALSASCTSSSPR